MAVSLTSSCRTLAVALALCTAEIATPAPPPAMDAAGTLKRANQYMLADNPNAAIPLYQQLTRAFPSEASVGVNLAIALFKAGRYQDALAECDRVLKLQPGLYPAVLFRGASYLKLGQPTNSLEPLRRALEMQPQDVNARIMLADALIATEHFAEAAESYEQAAETMSDSSRVWYGLYRSYRGVVTEIHAELQTLALGSAEFLALSGDIERDRGQLARAFELYRKALSARPQFRGIHGKIAAIYEQTGHADWAATERSREPAQMLCAGPSAECAFASGQLASAASSAGDTPGTLYWRASALQELALRALAKLDALPPSRERFEAQAETEERNARFQLAVPAWRQALQLAPRDKEFQRRLALALCQSNACAEALPILQELAKQNQASAEFNYLCGLALNSMQEAGKALPYLEAAVRLDGAFLPARAALGEAYMQAGSADRAIPHLELAARDDANGTRHYQLARAYQDAAKPEQARTALTAYREILARRRAEAEPRIVAP